MTKDTSVENVLLSKIPGMSEFFRITREPHKDIDSEFKKSESRVKDKGSKSLISDSSKIASITSKIILWNYKRKLSPSAKKYAEEIESTQGVYGKRDQRIRQSVDSMASFIEENYKSVKKKSDYTIFDLYLRIQKLLLGKQWSEGFNIAYKLHKKGNETSSLIFVEYVMLTYTMESLTLMLREYVDQISNNKILDANVLFCKKYSSFVTSVCKNAVKLLVKCENIKNPKKYITDALKVEKRISGKVSKESEFFKVDRDESEDLLHDKSHESVAAGLLGMGMLVIMFLAVIHGVRYMIYYFSCLMVDISNSLIDQSHILLVNIETLELELANLKQGSNEYKRLENIIERQKKYTQVLIDVAGKLSDTDIKSIDDIRSNEYEDNETIEETVESDDDSSDGFDI